MKLKDFEEMQKELEEINYNNIAKPNVSWGTWAGDLNLNELLEKSDYAKNIFI
ncbi:MAG: hypothetical protein AABW83_02390 [Nanoarchaeota archaeon]